MKASLLALGMKRILSRLGDQLVNEGMQPLPACGATGLPVFGLGAGSIKTRGRPTSAASVALHIYGAFAQCKCINQ